MFFFAICKELFWGKDKNNQPVAAESFFASIPVCTIRNLFFFAHKNSRKKWLQNDHSA